ncbi:MAG: ribosomal RNA small subunit methyltransferase A [Candidatus Omnitrophota bacterium]|nr:MAG: ribosomal RNA small subunit methyltransferase A [Candidatus Omnitrophota bacterium]
MKLSKSFGQIFLHDKKYVGKIIDALEIEGEVVVEIGPGSGIMTAKLIKKAKKLLCIEYDPRFYKLLNQRYKGHPIVEIIRADVLKFSLSKFKKKVVVFGNIPYHISNRLIHYLIENRKKIKRVYLTLQKEFADKLSASASTKAFSFLSCYLQYYASVMKLFDIPAGAFLPKPKVDSSFVKIDFYEKLPFLAKNEDFLFNLMRKAFMNRRKKITNSLPALKDKRMFLSSLGISPESRPQNLSVSDFVGLANKLLQLSPKK